MNSIFQIEQPPEPQPAGGEIEVPAEVRMNFAQLLDWYTPNIFVCWIILGIDVLVFAAMLISGYNPDHATTQALIKWGADYGPLTITQGQWWRFLTCVFVHAGFVHVGFNMMVLAQIGPFMERLLGNISFLIVYLICGIAGALCSLAWNPYIVSVGASGAILGLYGALIGFLVLRHDSIPRPVLIRLLRGAVVFLIYNAVWGFLNAEVDLAAHVGGLVAGVVCGLVVSNPINAGFTRRRIIRGTALGLASVPVVLALGALLPRPPDFIKEFNRLVVLEQQVNTNFSSMLTEVKAGRLKQSGFAHRIETDVIRPWDAERKSLASFTRLPGRQQRLRTVLLAYMDTREQAWKDLVQGLQTNNLSLLRQSTKLQAQAQSKLNESMQGLR